MENSKTSQYTWNSAHIDDTDIPLYVAAVGRNFKFPMNVNLATALSLNNAEQSTFYAYFRDVSIDSTFTTSVLQILIEDWRTPHRTGWDTQRTTKSFQIENVVKAHVQV